MEPKIQSYSELSIHIPPQENSEMLLTRSGKWVSVWTSIEKISTMQRLVNIITAIALVIFTAFTALLFQKARFFCQGAFRKTIEKKHYVDLKTLPQFEVVKVVRINGLLLEHVSDAFKDNMDVVLEAVGANGLALKYASETIRKNKLIIQKAIENCKDASQYTLEDIVIPDPKKEVVIPVPILIEPIIPAKIEAVEKVDPSSLTFLKNDPLKDINKQYLLQTTQFLSNALKEEPNSSHIVNGGSLLVDLLFMINIHKDNKMMLLHLLKSMEILHESATLENLDTLFKAYPNFISDLTEKVLKKENEINFVDSTNNKYIHHVLVPEYWRNFYESLGSDTSISNIKSKTENLNNAFSRVLKQFSSPNELTITHLSYQMMNWQKKFAFFPHLRKFKCQDGSVVCANFMHIKSEIPIYLGLGYTLISLPFDETDNTSSFNYKGYCLYSEDPAKSEEILEKFQSEIWARWSDIQPNCKNILTTLKMPILSFNQLVDHKKSFMKRDYKLNLPDGPSLSQKFEGSVNTNGIDKITDKIEGENIVVDKKISLQLTLDHRFLFFTVATEKATDQATLMTTMVVNNADFLFQHEGEKNLTLPPKEIKYNKISFPPNEISSELAKESKYWNLMKNELDVVGIQKFNPISFISFEVGNVKFKILNYTNHEITFDNERCLIINGRKVTFPFLSGQLCIYTEHDCYLIAFPQSNGQIAIYDYDLDEPPLKVVNILDIFGFNRGQIPIR